MESNYFKKLRAQCQIKEDDDKFAIFSIYITPIFLKLNISADIATYIGLFVHIIGGVLILSKYEQSNWILGAIFIFLAGVLDKVNGEIARYHKIESKFGAYLDGLFDTIRLGLLFIFVSYALYFNTGNIIALVFGTVAIFSLFIYNFSEKATYLLFNKEKMIAPITAYDDPGSRREITGFRKIAILISKGFTRHTLLLIFMIMDAVLDIYILTMIWIIFYALLFFAATIFRSMECGAMCRKI